MALGGCAVIPTTLRIQVIDGTSGQPLCGVRPFEEDIWLDDLIGPSRSWNATWPATNAAGETVRGVPLGMLNLIEISAPNFEPARITAVWHMSGLGRLDLDVVNLETPATKWYDGPQGRVSTRKPIIIRLYPAATMPGSVEPKDKLKADGMEPNNGTACPLPVTAHAQNSKTQPPRSALSFPDPPGDEGSESIAVTHFYGDPAPCCFADRIFPIQFSQRRVRN
jgi:hypothetical protein